MKRGLPVSIALLIAAIALVITPGLLFHYDVIPKLLLLLGGTAAILLVSPLGAAQGVKDLWSFPLGRAYLAVLLAAALWSLIAATASTAPELSWYGATWRRLGAITLVAAFLLAAIAAGSIVRGHRYLIQILSCSGVFAALYGIFQYFGIDPFLPHASYLAGEGPFTIVRPPGTMGHADYFAAWLVPAFFLSIAAFDLSPGRYWRAAFSLSAVVIFAAIVLSGTRSALAGIAVGAFAWFAMNRPRFTRNNAFIAGSTVLLLAALLVSPAGAKLRARIFWSSQDRLGGARLLLWRDCLHMAATRPLFGYGPETFGPNFPQFQSVELARAYPDFYHESPHNIFLDLFADQGLSGLLWLLALCAIPFAAAYPRGPNRMRTVHWFAAFAGLLAAQQFIAFVLPTLLLLLVLAGGVVASSSISQLSPKFSSPKLLRTAAALLSIPLLFYAFRLAISDRLMYDAQYHLDRSALPAAAQDYSRYSRWKLPGAGDDLDYSRKAFHAARVAPDNPTRQLAIAQSLAAAARAAHSGENTANAWYHLAILRAAVDDRAGVETSLRLSVRAAPRWFKSHWTLAQLLQLERRFPEALQEARDAADLDGGKHPEVLATLANLSKLVNSSR